MAVVHIAAVTQAVVHIHRLQQPPVQQLVVPEFSSKISVLPYYRSFILKTHYLLLTMGLEQMAYGAFGAIMLLCTAKFVWSLPGKIWHAIAPRKIADFSRKKKESVGIRLDKLLYRMIYRKLMERYKDDEVRLRLAVWCSRTVLKLGIALSCGATTSMGIRWQ